MPSFSDLSPTPAHGASLSRNAKHCGLPTKQSLTSTVLHFAGAAPSTSSKNLRTRMTSCTRLRRGQVGPLQQAAHQQLQEGPLRRGGRRDGLAGQHPREHLRPSNTEAVQYKFLLELLTRRAREHQAHLASAAHSTLKGLDSTPKNIKDAMSRKDRQEWADIGG